MSSSYNCVTFKCLINLAEYDRKYITIPVTCDFVLTKPSTISAQFCLPNFTHETWVNPWYGFHEHPNTGIVSPVPYFQEIATLINSYSHERNGTERHEPIFSDCFNVHVLGETWIILNHKLFQWEPLSLLKTSSRGVWGVHLHHIVVGILGLVSRDTKKENKRTQ